MVIRCIDLQNSHSFAGILPCQGGRIFNRSSDRVGRRKCMLCWEMSGLKKNATPRKVTKGQKNKPLKNCTAVKLSQTLAELSLNRSYKVSAKECQSWWIQKGLGPCTSIHSRKSIPILLKSIWMTPATEEMMREDFGWSVKRIVGIFLVELECRDGTVGLNGYLGMTWPLHSSIIYRFRFDFALDASRENMQHSDVTRIVVLDIHTPRDNYTYWL